jgi:PrtD family type I secretion system ABC transporter
MVLNASRAFRLALQILILGIGAYYVLAGELTAGAMIAASIILARALAPVERLIGAWHRYIAARAADRNLRQLFASATRREATKLPAPAGGLIVDNVNYLVPDTRDPILTNICFALEPGQNCAIFGQSGSGKSTLCRLLVGALKPNHGHVPLDGADVFTWDPADLGAYIGYLPQQVELFPATVAENIARFRKASSDQIIAAAKLAGVHDMILALPDGYETNVGLHGNRISLGQRQRLALARALFGDPAFIVLDEPNSNLDSDGDQALAAALVELKRRGRTVIIVTHRPVALQTADKVLMLRTGAVARFGDRDDVLKPFMQPAQPSQFRVAPAASGNGAGAIVAQIGDAQREVEK